MTKSTLLYEQIHTFIRLCYKSCRVVRIELSYKSLLVYRLCYKSCRVVRIGLSYKSLLGEGQFCDRLLSVNFHQIEDVEFISFHLVHCYSKKDDIPITVLIATEEQDFDFSVCQICGIVTYCIRCNELCIVPFLQ
ncbi:hypothetical protein WN51_10820 [Melipona quadrifasciata]|uniref:Uncharacterized protein n=1 Tax=Melipona quadrifasciata TaxID=166423 RepID=A0A0N0BI61_9HYME|nr:hypothetical protein WN51_10820 [Melipona quadrifasciata]